MPSVFREYDSVCSVTRLFYRSIYDSSRSVLAPFVFKDFSTVHSASKLKKMHCQTF